MEINVIRSNRKTIAAEIRQNKLIIRAPWYATNEDINRFLRDHQKWIDTHLAKAQAREKAKEGIHKLTQEEIQALANRACEVIPARVAHYAPLIGVTYGRITIRCQRSRWGSCSSKGNLNFNCLLMLTPPEVIDSVVVHELCHRKEMNHSDRFYAEVLRVFPDYWAQHQWLKENGDMLLAMLGE
ncbi:MAG: M48 family metallopeptidase [Clostridia bacterium]|nr:M48 family metallopeptidase [Clostridia bacterium]